MIASPHRDAVIASFKTYIGRRQGGPVWTLEPTLLGPCEISLELTVAVVSGFLLGDLVLISSLLFFHK